MTPKVQLEMLNSEYYLLKIKKEIEKNVNTLQQVRFKSSFRLQDMMQLCLLISQPIPQGKYNYTKS